MGWSWNISQCGEDEDGRALFGRIQRKSADKGRATSREFIIQRRKKMNELKIFTREQYIELKNIEQNNHGTYYGFFYALEYGELLKIGSTLHPYQRVCALSSNAEHYGEIKTGRVLISAPHTNFRTNEIKLHNFFADVRKEKTELFKTSIEEVIIKLPYIVEYRDDSELIERGEKKFLIKMQEFINPHGLCHDIASSSNPASCIDEVCKYLSAHETLHPEGIELLLQDDTGCRFLAKTWQKVDDITDLLQSMTDKATLINSAIKELNAEGEQFTSLYEEIKKRADFTKMMIDVYREVWG